MRPARRAAPIENLNSKIKSPSVLTLADLEAWSFDGTALAVVGQPIKHSLSPAMHNAALTSAARTEPRFATWRYFRFEIAPADLPRALALFHEKRFRGLNLTVPHKVLAVASVASIDPAAQPAGAVNTLLWTDRGWQGHNTDGDGLAAGIRDDLTRDLAGSHVILLGAGGAARGAAVACLQRRCASLTIANRTRANLDNLLGLLAPLSAGVPLRGFDPATPPADLPPGAIVVNATSAGLRTDDPPPIDLAALPSPAAVYDMVYNPPQSALLRAAAARGIPTANGLSMLAHQGARALEIWSGLPAATTAPAMLAAARAAL